MSTRTAAETTGLRPTTPPAAPSARGQGFSTDALIEMSRLRDEPEWLLESRLRAWRLYEQLPFPSRKDEEWRRTDLSSLDLEAVAPLVAGDGPKELPETVREAIREVSSQAGLLAHWNASPVHHFLSPEVARQGVIFTDLRAAVREHPERVRPQLMAQLLEGDGKFAALHAAFWSGGSFLYLPRDVEVELPLHALALGDVVGSAIMSHTLIVAEAGSRATLVDEYASENGRGPRLANGGVEIHLGPGAKLQYVSLQRWGEEVFNFALERASIAKDAELTSLSVVLGGRFSKSWVEARLQEAGAVARMVGIMCGAGNQRFHHHTLQDHQAQDTTSDLLYKTALADHARSEYSGLIRVHKDARRSNAYQANRNLLLSTDSRADSMPKLEIENNDVRCTHGATVGPIDEEQLFYLMARGLPRAMAERMIVSGFFDAALEQITTEAVRDKVRKAVEAKLGVGTERPSHHDSKLK